MLHGAPESAGPSSHAERKAMEAARRAAAGGRHVPGAPCGVSADSTESSSEAEDDNSDNHDDDGGRGGCSEERLADVSDDESALSLEARLEALRFDQALLATVLDENSLRVAHIDDAFRAVRECLFETLQLLVRMIVPDVVRRRPAPQVSDLRSRSGCTRCGRAAARMQRGAKCQRGPRARPFPVKAACSAFVSQPLMCGLERALSRISAANRCRFSSAGHAASQVLRKALLTSMAKLLDPTVEADVHAAALAELVEGALATVPTSILEGALLHGAAGPEATVWRDTVGCDLVTPKVCSLFQELHRHKAAALESLQQVRRRHWRSKRVQTVKSGQQVLQRRDLQLRRRLHPASVSSLRP